jgi:hypothetical protein
MSRRKAAQMLRPLRPRDPSATKICNTLFRLGSEPAGDVGAVIEYREDDRRIGLAIPEPGASRVNPGPPRCCHVRIRPRCRKAFAGEDQAFSLPNGLGEIGDRLRSIEAPVMLPKLGELRPGLGRDRYAADGSPRGRACRSASSSASHSARSSSRSEARPASASASPRAIEGGISAEVSGRSRQFGSTKGMTRG